MYSPQSSPISFIIKYHCSSAENNCVMSRENASCPQWVRRLWFFDDIHESNDLFIFVYDGYKLLDHSGGTFLNSNSAEPFWVGQPFFLAIIYQDITNKIWQQGHYNDFPQKCRAKKILLFVFSPQYNPHNIKTGDLCWYPSKHILESIGLW